MAETVLSVGIDIGTSTTQLVFSSLTIENVASVAAIPRITVVDKRVVYRSDIHFTPLLSPTTIDADGVRRIVEQEYARADVDRNAISAGAVIITGETARKENAETVLRSLSGLAGNFVVATAGSDLESILAGKGAGAGSFSRREHMAVANFDIGGGTTNVVLFRDGDVVDTTCLDIGGRLVKLDPKTRVVQYVAPGIATLVESMGLPVAVGRAASVEDLTRLTDRMAEFFDELMGLRDRTPLFERMLTAHDLRAAPEAKGVSFSGGVADCIDSVPEAGLFAYGDIGVLLGQSVARTQLFRTLVRVPTEETIRATVVGAGSHSMEISGSTIGFSDPALFPLQNVPVLKLTPEDETGGLSEALARKLRWYTEGNPAQPVGISFRGVHSPSFDQVQGYASQLVAGLSEYLQHQDLVIVVVEKDMAKALGFALGSRLGDSKKLVCIDGVSVDNGDYIDMGCPLSGGRVIPVVIKTLVFGG